MESAQLPAASPVADGEMLNAAISTTAGQRAQRLHAQRWAVVSTPHTQTHSTMAATNNLFMFKMNSALATGALLRQGAPNTHAQSYTLRPSST